MKSIKIGIKVENRNASAIDKKYISYNRQKIPHYTHTHELATASGLGKKIRRLTVTLELLEKS